jgi:hypothetical protein
VKKTPRPLAFTALIQSQARVLIARAGLRPTAVACGVDATQLGRFARGERQLQTGETLDRLVAGLGLRVSIGAPVVDSDEVD